MSKAMQLVGIILLGIITLVIINLMNDVRSTSELDYYLLQEVTEAAMYDAVDYSYYRDTGLLKVDRDMFLENFNRRFSASVTNNRDYNIRIVDFNETPPKVSIEVKAPTVASVKSEVAVLETKVSGILETIYDDLVMSKGSYQDFAIDDTAPIITVTSNSSGHSIKMTDETALEEYCIAYLPKDELEYSSSKASGGFHCYQDISGLKEKTLSRSVYINNEYNEWIIVYDRAGNYAYKPLADTAPYIKSYSYLDGKLNIIMRDNENVASYLIMMDSFNLSNTGNYLNGGWQSAGTNIKVGSYYQATVNLKFLSDYAKVGTHDYYIYAKDNNGQISASVKLTINKADSHAPQIIQNEFDKDNKKLYITFEDVDGDLAYYAITKDNSEPKTWTIISGKIKTIEYSVSASGKYYIWVKDSMGNSNQSESELISLSYPAVLVTEESCPAYGAYCGSWCPGDEYYDYNEGHPICSAPGGWVDNLHGIDGADCCEDEEVWKCPSGGTLNGSTKTCEF